MPGRRSTSGDGAARPADGASGDRSTGEVLASLVVNAQALIAKEVELVGLELKALVGRKAAAVAALLVGALAAAGVLLLGAVTTALALERLFAERWMAWGVVTAGVAIITLILFLLALRTLAGSWSPRTRRTDRTSTTDWLRALGSELTGTSNGTDDDRDRDGHDGLDDQEVRR